MVLAVSHCTSPYVLQSFILLVDFLVPDHWQSLHHKHEDILGRCSVDEVLAVHTQGPELDLQNPCLKARHSDMHLWPHHWGGRDRVHLRANLPKSASSTFRETLSKHKARNSSGRHLMSTSSLCTHTHNTYIFCTHTWTQEYTHNEDKPLAQQILTLLYLSGALVKSLLFFLHPPLHVSKDPRACLDYSTFLRVLKSMCISLRWSYWASNTSTSRRNTERRHQRNI